MTKCLVEIPITIPSALAKEMALLAESCGLTPDQMCSAVFILQMRRQGDISFPSDDPNSEIDEKDRAR